LGGRDQEDHSSRPAKVRKKKERKENGGREGGREGKKGRKEGRKEYPILKIPNTKQEWVK
jgi:hypothetical protein